MTFTRRLAGWAGAHLQALGLSLLFALSAGLLFWYGAFLVPDQRQAAIERWGRDLAVLADTRRDLLDRRISEGTEGASFVATFPSVRALTSSVRNGGSGEGPGAHVEGILSNFRDIYRERSISIHDAGGAVLASSDGPAPGADAVALAREAARSRKPRIDLVREPDGFIGFVVAAPVRESSQNAETGGAVLVVGSAEGKVFDILRQPFTAATGEALLVRKEGDAALHLSPLRFRPDPPLTLRHQMRAGDHTTREVLEGDDVFGSFVDYRGVKVLAAGRMLKRAPWSLLIKVDEDEALAPFRRDVLRRGLTWGGLLLALIAAAVGFWRALVASHEVTLARSEARFGALVEQATDAIFLVGSDARVLQANRAAEVTYGWTRDELLSMHATDIRASATRDALRHDMETAAARGSLLVETRHRRADGSEFPVEVNIGLVKAGNETLFLSIVRDITERKRAEANVSRLNAELEEALAWQRQIFEGSRDAVFLSDEDGRFVAVNRAATELTGFSSEELLAMAIPDLHDDPDLVAYRSFHRRILDGERILSEAPIKKKNGGKVAVEFNNSLVVIGGKRFMHTAGRDVTERTHLEAQLVQAQKMEAVGRLAGGVAHDFNNLLTVIQGYGEMVRDSLSSDPRHESMEELLKAAGRAASLTRQLLAFSRKQVLELKIVRLDVVVRETGRMLERLIGEHIALSLVLPETLATVKADPGQIEQVVLNLAVNARDAMPGGGRLTISVDSVTEPVPIEGFPEILPAGRWVRLTVEDTGCGMDAETLSHAFEPFFTTKERGKGTGLGLSTVYGIVRQSDGFVQVTSEAGKGTTFRIYLPRSGEEKTSGIRPSVLSRQGTETVLVVEDEPAVRSLVRAVLERKGYVVLAAQDGAAALDLVDKRTGVIHVLLTDVVMPGMNGRDLAALVKTRRPTIKVVFMSGYTTDVPAALGAEGGPVFLSKPFTEQTLTAKLREALDTPQT